MPFLQLGLDVYTVYMYCFFPNTLLIYFSHNGNALIDFIMTENSYRYTILLHGKEITLYIIHCKRSEFQFILQVFLIIGNFFYPQIKFILKPDLVFVIIQWQKWLHS